jgi:hypothetical protein
MRSLGISEIESFPFPTSPPPISLKRALDLLINLGISVPIYYLCGYALLAVVYVSHVEDRFFNTPRL